MRAEKRGHSGEHADSEAERHRVRRIAQAAEAVDHIAAGTGPTPPRPHMHPHPLKKAFRLAAPEQHYHLKTRYLVPSARRRWLFGDGGLAYLGKIPFGYQRPR